MAEDGEEPKHTVNKFSDALEELSNSAGNEADLDPDDYLAGFVQTGRIEAAAAIWNTFKEGDDHGILDNDEQMRKMCERAGVVEGWLRTPTPSVLRAAYEEFRADPEAPDITRTKAWLMHVNKMLGRPDVVTVPDHTDYNEVVRKWDADRKSKESMALAEAAKDRPPTAAAPTPTMPPTPQVAEKYIPTLDEAYEIKLAWIQRGARQDDEHFEAAAVADAVILTARYEAALAREAEAERAKADEAGAGDDTVMGEGA